MAIAYGLGPCCFCVDLATGLWGLLVAKLPGCSCGGLVHCGIRACVVCVRRSCTLRHSGLLYRPGFSGQGNPVMCLCQTGLVIPAFRTFAKWLAECLPEGQEVCACVRALYIGCGWR